MSRHPVAPQNLSARTGPAPSTRDRSAPGVAPWVAPRVTPGAGKA